MNAPRTDLRTEYRALADVTADLCAWFDYHPSRAQLDAVTEALVACEAIDRHLDDGVGCRDTRFQHIAENLTSDAGLTEGARAARRLCRALAPFMDATELERRLWSIESATRRQLTRGRARFIRAVEDEGIAFTELFTPIFHDAPAPFLRFFLALGAPGNLIDKFIDAKRDYEQGELLIRPSILHHLHIALAFFAHGPRVLRRARRRRAFLLWTVRLTVHQARGAMNAPLPMPSPMSAR